MVDEMFDGPGDMDVSGDEVVMHPPPMQQQQPQQQQQGNNGQQQQQPVQPHQQQPQHQQLLASLTAADRTTHADFMNDFGCDLFDEQTAFK